MIVTVTMNPAIDKTVDIDSLEQGGLNRIQRIELDAGGKGINVSKTIKQLGGTSIATGFIAGNAGEVIEKVLSEYGIQTDFIRVSGETRTNMKVVEKRGVVTELNEPGPKVSEADLQELIGKLESYASPETLIVLSGSIPSGVDKNIYRTITEKMHAKGASVLLDADGGLFVNALEAKPDIIKPNRVELEEYYHLDHQAAEEELVELGRKLQDKGIGFVAISMGGSGAIFLGKEEGLKCRGLSVKTHSTVGAGDAMVAALAWGWERKLPMREAAALGMATSAGAVTTVGTKPPARELVDELLKQVELDTLL
ncbi:MAG: 1-phosphofructokinase [Lachnospiraceae bacterium]|nr:1-phosphofructokinase [Lachnospiraceae bacterium]